MFDTDFARRAFLFGAARLAVAPSVASLLPQIAAATAPSEPLNHFVNHFMAEMNAPGLTLGLATRSGPPQAISFGFADLEAKTPLTPDHLFEIGSITKSFVALTLLQLREEGKVEFDKPILDYLPWLPIETPFGAITVHHLLTHSSGLPDSLTLFLSDPASRHIQGFKPGEHFYYSNVGFAILGYLIAKLDQRPWTISIQDRILKPLGMTASRTAIGDDTREREPSSYVPFRQAGVYLRHGRLTKTGPFAFEDAAGSICAPAGDMARYLLMLLNQGKRPGGQIVSKESFDLFSKPYISAAEFSPTASYGYGVAIDKLDGHTILRHTGGMASFMSAMHVDLDAGVAAFASINAQLGYRPNLVTQYAVQVLRAKAENKTIPPPPPEIPNALEVKSASDFAGLFTNADGRSLEVKASTNSLQLTANSKTFPLQVAGDSVFLATDPDWQRFPIVFERAESPDQAKSSERAVIGLAYGSDSYVHSHHTGPKSIPAPAEFHAYAGHYLSDTPWAPSVTIVLRNGKLWLEGTTPFIPLGANLFRYGLAETAEFHYVVEGKAQMVRLSGLDLFRSETA